MLGILIAVGVAAFAWVVAFTAVAELYFRTLFAALLGQHFDVADLFGMGILLIVFSIMPVAMVGYVRRRVSRRKYFTTADARYTRNFVAGLVVFSFVTLLAPVYIQNFGVNQQSIVALGAIYALSIGYYAYHWVCYIYMPFVEEARKTQHRAHRHR